MLKYFTLFAAFACCSLFAARTHEMTDRQNFFYLRRRKRELKEWKQLVEALPEPVIFTLKGGIKFFNSATLKLFGLDNDTGKSFEEKRINVIVELSKVTRKSNTHEISSLKDVIEELGEFGEKDEQTFKYRKGKEKHVIVIKRMHTSSQSVVGEKITEYIFNDITMLKRQEKNKAKENCLDIMLSTVSHDIRTPLNIALGVLDGIADQLNTPETMEQLAVVQCCGQRILNYLQGLTMIRQLNSNRLTVNKKKFNVRETVGNLMRTEEYPAGLKNLSLKYTEDGYVPPAICSDKDIYVTVLNNLLENAVKYTFAGDIDIVLQYVKEDNMLVTQVRDTGIGMTQEQLNNAGMIFNRLESHCNLNPQGLGLGLFLAKELPLKLDGCMKLYSEAGKGTIAEFKIRCYPFEEATVDHTYLHLPASPTLPRKLNRPSKLKSDVYFSFPQCNCPKALLVDDEPLNLVVLSGYLSSINVEADRAENGKIAIDKIKAKAYNSVCCRGYDVIFMDINMPVMDGINATSIIRNMIREGDIPHCNVVAVTAAAGLDDPSVYAKYIEQGFSELCNF